MVVRISDKTQNYSKVTKLLVKPNRITEYNKESKIVSCFYNDHKDEKRYDITDNVIDFINRLIIHIPNYHFLTI